MRVKISSNSASLIEERVVLRCDLAVGLDEVEGHFVPGLHAQERPEGDRPGQAEDLGQERGRCVLVAGVDDGVIELDGHRARDPYG